MTPRPYISYSQLTLWEKSPDEYVDVYLRGKKLPINRGMAFGKQLAEGLEKDESVGNPIIDLLSASLPRFEAMEHELRVDYKRGKEVIPLLCRLDTAKRNLTGFYEYKTGQTAWSKKKVDEWDQITFYATAIFLATGKIPTDIELIHIFTAADENGRIEPTGDIVRYPTIRRMPQILNMMIRISKAWSGINKRFNEELA